jgi:hypothetical protein
MSPRASFAGVLCGMSGDKGVMRLRLSKAVRLVLAAFASVFASVLVFGVSVATAGPYYFHRPRDYREPVRHGGGDRIRSRTRD